MLDFEIQYNNGANFVKFGFVTKAIEEAITEFNEWKSEMNQFIRSRYHLVQIKDGNGKIIC